MEKIEERLYEVEKEIETLKQGKRSVYTLSERNNSYENDFKILGCFSSVNKVYKAAKEILEYENITKDSIENLSIGQEVESYYNGDAVSLKIQRFLLK
jgi:hypothetical protein